MNRERYLDRIRGLPCVVCLECLGQKTYGCAAHHVESVRDGHSDFAVAALCHEHHQGQSGVHWLHRRGFEARWNGAKAYPLLARALSVDPPAAAR